MKVTRRMQPRVKGISDYPVYQALTELRHDRITAMNKVPEGWTDDMTIVVPAGRSLDELVDYVLQSTIRRETQTKIIQYLTEEFGFTQGDAALALDRTYGGVVRAATGQRKNCPAKEKDPLAWLSFHRCLK